MAKKRVLILGAGLAGLSAAWHLQKKGIEACVFEANSQIGGLCRSKNVNGFTFDCDGHILHFKHHHTFNLVRHLLCGNLREHRRDAYIYSSGCYSRYPFQANLYGLPPAIVKECLLGFIDASNNGKFIKRYNISFFQWINQVFGSGIAKHFMVPYNTKFWTVSPKELTCEWLDGFIPIPSLSQVLEGTVEESKRQFGYNAHFWYPKKGAINQLPLALADNLKNIYTECRVSSIDPLKKEVRLDSGAKEKFDLIISTIPLPEMPSIIKGMPKDMKLIFKKLRWNSVFNINLGMAKNDSFRRHWVYFPQGDVCFFRVGFFHNFSSCLVPEGKNSLYVEVSYSKERPIDKNNIFSRIERDLKRVGILSGTNGICAMDINDIEYGYPIYDKNCGRTRQEILRYLLKNSIISAGRYGSWRYLSMEDAFLDGRSAAERCLGKPLPTRIPLNQYRGKCVNERIS